MKIKIRLHGHVAALLEQDIDGLEIESDNPLTVAELLEEQLDVNPMLFAAVVVDGQSRSTDYLLDDDAEVLLVSPAAGG